MSRASDRGTRPLRVMVVEANEDGTVGGSHQVMFDTLIRADRERFHPIACFYQDNVFADRLRDRKISVVVLHELRTREFERVHRTPQALRKMLHLPAIVARARILRTMDVDLLHLNNSPQVGYLDWLPAARMARKPIVVSAMGDAEPLPGRIRPRLVASFDHYLPVSHYMATALRRQRVPESRITTVRNGIDVARIRSEARGSDAIRSELGIPHNAMLGVMVGNIRHWKGQHVVLEALGRLQGSDTPWVVAFAGAEDSSNQDYANALRARVSELGLEESVRWLGRRSDVPALFAAADIGVHASVIPEPFGLVMVECMAVGTPVVAAQEGGASEIVTPETGWTYRGGDDEELARILLDLGKRSNRTMAAAGVEEACVTRAMTLDASSMARGVEAVWSHALGRGPHPGLGS